MLPACGTEDDSKAFFGAEIANMGKMNTDWMGRYFNQKRLWHSHSLTIASGNEKTQYKISFNYKNNEDRYEGDHRDYFYLTTDLTHQVLPFLKVGISNRAFYNVNHDKPDMFETFLPPCRRLRRSTTRTAPTTSIRSVTRS